METKYYIVARIDGDYAWLNRTDAEEEPLFIAGRSCRKRSTRGRS